ncbi:ubox domain containing protein [Stylonychia lemnae]|uniref:Ubox domain containing protein n=1 Tax=Stylonychia lemnae TaxID=5949 RepID=A0A078AEK3_STYLE|nr:ubox domain containing protein [Stylonychia lemnae]|eukprot:CDW79897.1 ubox domain containing protein [Stylonychia lemnae]
MERRESGGGVMNTLIKVGIAALVGIGTHLITKAIDKHLEQQKVTAVEEKKEDDNLKFDYKLNKSENLMTTSESNYDENGECLNSFLCPITQQIMKEPVMTKYGHCFEKSAILDWIERQGKCPLTQQPLTKQDLFPNYAIKGAIEEYMQKQKQLLEKKQL